MLLALALLVLPLQAEAAPTPPAPLSSDDLRAAARVIGLELSDAELELMLRGVEESRRHFEALRACPLDNATAPVLGYGGTLERLTRALPRPLEAEPRARVLPDAQRPADLGELCFADIPTLAALVKSRKVSCVELARVHLERLARIDAELHCVVTLLSERALARAAELDKELAAGRWRGMLHGIPYGAKDLLAARGGPTTWGSRIFAEQVFEEDAEVVRRLEEAGAVLVAKLALGELAWGDVWFRERTRNPWKPEQGSSGSSAGPAAAVAAGGVPFALGSETCGSILSPSARCGVSSLRPTFGRVSRHGAMALSWSMDKLGPMARSIGDAALVFAAIQGVDPRDEDTLARPFVDPGPIEVKGWRVGYVAGAWRSQAREEELLASLRALGVEPLAVTLPEHPTRALLTILNVEAAAAFDELTRDGRDELMVRQIDMAWPNVFRTMRLVPAVEYLRANRLRRALVVDYMRLFERIDVLVHPSTHGELLVALNLTGHPSACVPTALREDGTPGSLAFSGQLFDEARVLAFAEAWQRQGGHHLLHPPR